MMQMMLGPSDDWVFDRAGVRAVDRAAVEEYGIPGVVLMENAARGLHSPAGYIEEVLRGP